MKWILSLTLTFCWLSGNVYGQQLSPEEHRLVLRALIDRDEALAKVRELTGQLAIADSQGELHAQRLQIERDLRLAEKNLYIGALQALAEYRTTRRPLFVKIITFGIVRDKHDRKLEADIAALQAEIQAWR